MFRCIGTLLRFEAAKFLLDVAISGDLLGLLLFLHLERFLLLFFASLIGEGVESSDSADELLELR